jgi:hypothetical protein
VVAPPIASVGTGGVHDEATGVHDTMTTDVVFVSVDVRKHRGPSSLN